MLAHLACRQALATTPTAGHSDPWGPSSGVFQVANRLVMSVNLLLDGWQSFRVRFGLREVHFAFHV